MSLEATRIARSLSSDDEAAIALFIREGGREEDWPLVDESVRLHYRLRKRPDSAMKITGAASPPNGQIDAMGKVLRQGARPG